MSDDAILSDVKRGDAGRFLPGAAPVSKGRPKGARNKLGEAFLADLLADFEVHGPAVIAAVRVDKPDQYLKVVASILPRELNIKVNELDELTDDQLVRQLAAVTALLTAGSLSLGAGVAPAEIAQQPVDVPTLQ
jgi:non-ribosomal peptide synthetase component E (peptide arylation enzyme)